MKRTERYLKLEMMHGFPVELFHVFRNVLQQQPPITRIDDASSVTAVFQKCIFVETVRMNAHKKASFS